MSATTKFAPAPGEMLPVVDLDAHRADMAKRQAAIDANRDEMLKCHNPAHARARERAKPMFAVKVSAKWSSKDKEGKQIYREGEEVVPAQNEQDAWAKFCDIVGDWPSRRDSNAKFITGKRLSAEAVEAAMEGDAEADSELPVVAMGSLAKRKKR